LRKTQKRFEEKRMWDCCEERRKERERERERE
jgi:hypothetical protein